MLSGISSLLSSKVEIKIKLDENSILDKSVSGNRVAHAFDVEGSITGTVRLSLPDNGRIYHYGVKLVLIQSIVFHEPADVSIDLCSHTHELMPEGHLSTAVELPFLIDLLTPAVAKCKPSKLATGHDSTLERSSASSSTSSAPSSSSYSYFGIPLPSLFSYSSVPTNNSNQPAPAVGTPTRSLRLNDEEMNASASPGSQAGSQSPVPVSSITIPNMATNLYEWTESFEGVNFSIRHKIEVSIARSWFESAVSVQKPLRLYKIMRPTFQQLQEPVTLIVPDCEGKCIVELQSKFIDIGGLCNITVTFQNMKKPITALYIMLIKAEHIEDLSLDKIILVHRVFGYGTQAIIDDISEDALLAEGFRSRIDEEVENARPNDPVMLGAQFELDLSTDIVGVTINDHSDHEMPVPRIPSIHTADMSSTSSSDDPDNEVAVHSLAPIGADREEILETALTEPTQERVSTSKAVASSARSSSKGDSGATPRSTLASSRSVNSSSPSEDSSDSIELFTPSFDSSPWGLYRNRILLGDDNFLDKLDMPFAVAGSAEANKNNRRLLSASDSLVNDPFHRSLSTTMLDEGMGGPSAQLRVASSQSPPTLPNTHPPNLTEPQASAMGIPDEMFRILRKASAETSNEGNLINSASRIPNIKSSNTSDFADDYKSRSLHSSDERGDAHAKLEQTWKDSLKDTVAVRYYLRVVVQDAFEKVCWNTTELILYRKESPPKANAQFSSHV